MRVTALSLIVSLPLVLLAAPLAVDAQQATRVYRIGVLLSGPVSALAASVQAFRERLRELGYIEGQNLALELRGTTTAAKRATSTVPIVMVAVGDPVGAELVASLARPGHNVT